LGKRIREPVYQKIALDVASRIFHGEFKEGERIHGRSTLAGEYNVSPETIRRAMNLLEDMGVVTISRGSGIYISSKENSGRFIKRFQNKETIGSLKAEIRKLTQEKDEIERRIRDVINRIIDYSDRFRNINRILPIEISIPQGSHIIGRTISGTKFWQNTGGTIIGIRRNSYLVLSPGPYMEFMEGDTILVIGDNGVLQRIKKYLEE
jgi:K+/H+ antiporter YhaU regulatory subunit KhtT